MAKKAGRGRAGARKAAPRGRSAQGGRKATKRTAKSATAAGRKRTGATARKAATGTPRGPARKQTAKSKARATKVTKSAKATKTARGAKGTKTVKAARPRSVPARKTAGGGRKTVVARKSPALNRDRRVVTEDEDIIQSTPPSSLDLDRTASAARTGRRSLRERHREHTETSPTLTGGDVDADWESAYSVGDEAPGGDNPTPDQDIVDDIGRAVGVEYQDNEELKGAKKVEERDKHRWELDPASSEDWDDR